MNRRTFLQALGLSAAIPAVIKAEPEAQPVPNIVIPPEGHRKIYSTGIPELDKSLGGGIRTGCVGLVLGAPGSGTSAMLRIMYNTNKNQSSYSYSYGKNYDNPGQCDVLHLWPGKNDFEDGGHLSCDIYAPHLLTEENLRVTRHYADASNVAIMISCKPEKMSLYPDDEESFFGWMRLLDYALSLHKGIIHVIKSRYREPGSLDKIPYYVSNGSLVAHLP